MTRAIIKWSAENRWVVILATAALVAFAGYVLRTIPVDAIPDLSDTQVIVYSRWDRSPDIIEDQVTYPIVASLLGAPKVKTVRGFSDFGFSYVYLIFEDGTDMYWARTRVLEYLSKITPQLPAGVKTELGPDASLEVLSPAITGKGGRVAIAAESAAPATPPTGSVGGGVAIGKDHDHGLDLLVGNQVIDDHIGRAAPRPLPVFIAADAVQQVQNGVLLVFCVARRSVHLHPPFNTNRLGIVIGAFNCAVGNAFADLVKAFRRLRKSFFVVFRTEGNGSAKSAASAPSASAAFRGCSRLSRSVCRHACGHEFFFGELTDRSCEFDFIWIQIPIPAGEKGKV